MPVRKEIMQHSLYGPSSLERRMSCPGSARMERDLPDIPSEHSERGTEMHALVVKALKEPVADELAMEIAAELKQKPGQIFTELTLPCDFIKQGEFGTLDFAAVIPFGEAYIEDWKFGWTSVEPARSNLQLAAYAVAIWTKYECSSVTVALRQPMRNHYSSHTYTAERLAAVSKHIGNHIVEDCEKPDAPLFTGKHCQFCKAAGQCPERLQMIQAPAELVSLNTVAEFVAKCHDANFREVLGKAERMIYSTLAAGGTVPGFVLKEGRAKNRQWTDEAEPIIAGLLGAAAYQPAELISPAAAERLKVKREVLDRVTRRDPGEMKLERVKGGV